MLDLSQFDSVDDALAKVAPGKRYVEIGSMVLGPESLPITLPSLFWFSMITRSEELHAAIVREVAAGNPHAVFPLIRAYAEAVVLVLYMLDHPRDVEAVMDRPHESQAL